MRGTEPKIKDTGSQIRATESESRDSESQIRATESAIMATESEKRATEFDIRATELGNRATEWQIRAIELENRATELDIRATESEKRATELQITAIEFEKRATELQITATEWEKRAIELQIRATESEKRATEWQIRANESVFRATEPEVRGSETQIEVIELEFRANESVFRATEPEIRGSETQIEVIETESRATEPEIRITEPEIRITESQIRATESEFRATEPENSATTEPESRATGSEYRVYTKGMVSEDELVIGIGVAVCDSEDSVVYKVGKQYEEAGLSGPVAEIVAVIHGLTAAVELDLKRVVFYFDYRTLYQFLIGQWTPRHPTIVALVNSVNEIRENFEYSAPALVARDDVEFAFELAREAMFSQVNRPSDSSSQNKINETCDICLEDKDVSLFFIVENCSHRYCFSCMKQHVETKLRNGMVPKCPFEGCKSELNIESCRNFLTRKLIKLMAQRLKEASIPVTEKVYCPYRRCSFLMSQEEVFEFSSERAYNIESDFRLCVKCERKFCINCKVPWHYGLNCRNYKRRNPNPSEEDTELNILANRNLWRQCVKCNHMIELDAGCYHMTCRCGYEFRYTCGAEWKDKRASCSCPLWDEQNILDEDYESDEENYYFDDEDLDEDESDSDDYN